MPMHALTSLCLTATATASTAGIFAGGGFRAWQKRRTAPCADRVAGKSLLIISAGGMVLTLLSLATGHFLGSAALLLATLLALQFLLQRAVSRFHASRNAGLEHRSVGETHVSRRASKGHTQREKKLFSTAPATPSSAACSMD